MECHNVQGEPCTIFGSIVSGMQDFGHYEVVQESCTQRKYRHFCF